LKYKSLKFEVLKESPAFGGIEELLQRNQL
jgi:hypothetical protein